MPSQSILPAKTEEQAIQAALDGGVGVLQQTWVKPIKTHVYVACGAIKVAMEKTKKFSEIAFKQGVRILEYTGDEAACITDIGRASSSVST